MIVAESLYKDYGSGRGVFDLSLLIKQGEVYGFLGPNGAGKTTTIRMLLGFIKPDTGCCFIDNIRVFEGRDFIMKKLGYLPAEINFFEGMNGMDFLRFMGKIRNLNDTSYRDELIKYFDVDTGVNLKRMSKGMKQKVAIVSAFMHRPDVIILDEPTSGLDPLMQSKFNDLVLKEKDRGVTILMSSHSLEEVEKTCDRIGIIKNGKLVAEESIQTIISKKQKRYVIVFKNDNERLNFEQQSGYKCINGSGRDVLVIVDGDINDFIKGLSYYKIEDIRTEQGSLEELFMHYYK